MRYASLHVVMAFASPEASTSAGPRFELEDASMSMQVDEPVIADEPVAVAEKPSKAAKGMGKAAGPKKPVQATGEPGKTVLPAVRALSPSYGAVARYMLSRCRELAPFRVRKLMHSGPRLAHYQGRCGRCDVRQGGCVAHLQAHGA